MKKLLGLLCIVVVGFYALPKAKVTVERLLAGSGVSQELVERSWEEQSLGNLAFEAPFTLYPEGVDIPSGLGDKLMSSETKAREKEGLMIMAMRATYVDGVEISMQGAVAGAEKSMRAAAGVESVQFSYSNTSVAGLPAATIDAQVIRNGKPPQRFRGLVIARGTSLYQLLVSYRADQPNGDRVWSRVKSTTTIDGRS